MAFWMDLMVGLSYYSRLRHEMRVAFWWKLNWSWFCLIQTSYNIATSPVSPTEINPFPNTIQLETDYDLPPPQIKKEPQDTPRLQNTPRPQDIPRNVDSAIEPDNSPFPTPKSSDQDTISEPMEDVITSYNVPPRFQRYWDLAKRLNRRPKWPRELGSQTWIEIGDFLVEMGHELSKFGLLDMELGLWENEIMHRKQPFCIVIYPFCIVLYLLNCTVLYFALLCNSSWNQCRCRLDLGDILTLGIGGVLDAWRRREMDILRLSNEEFEKLGVEEKKVMIASIMEDDRRMADRRTR